MSLTKIDREDVLGDGSGVPCVRCNGLSTKTYKKRSGKKKYFIFTCEACHFKSVYSPDVEDMIINENSYFDQGESKCV